MRDSIVQDILVVVAGYVEGQPKPIRQSTLLRSAAANAVAFAARSQRGWRGKEREKGNAPDDLVG